MKVRSACHDISSISGHSTFNIEHSTFAFPAKRTMKATIRTFGQPLLAALLLAGLATGGGGLWMYAQAAPAQNLLEMMWGGAPAGGRVKPLPPAHPRAPPHLAIPRGGG